MNDPRTGLFWFLRHGYVSGGHARFLGLEFVSVEEGRGVLRLPYRPDLAGDAETGVLGGGAVTALLDHVGGMAVLSALTKPGMTATLDLRIDYLRPAQPGRDVLAEAHCYRMTRSVAFVRASAYEDDPAYPVATAQATFAMTGFEGGAA
jgi:uncharacterized protein (TIGR00369 family)